jgi:hypothetical protein
MEADKSELLLLLQRTRLGKHSMIMTGGRMWENDELAVDHDWGAGGGNSESISVIVNSFEEEKGLSSLDWYTPRSKYQNTYIQVLHHRPNLKHLLTNFPLLTRRVICEI